MASYIPEFMSSFIIHDAMYEYSVCSPLTSGMWEVWQDSWSLLIMIMETQMNMLSEVLHPDINEKARENFTWS